MTKSFPFNFKQTYQSSSICPFSLLFSRTCLEYNVFQIVIMNPLCRSKNIPNPIILLNLDFFPWRLATIYFWFLLLLRFLFGIRTFFGVYSCRLLLLWWSFLLLLHIVSFPFLFRIINENQINLFTYAYLSFGLYKIVLLQSFFVIFVVFLNCFKSPFELR